MDIQANDLSGERRLVTVLFADFAGFTAWVHQKDAEDVRDYMDLTWAKLDAILVAHGGLVQKHIGDAVMAVFGAVQAREDDAVQAVRAALAIQGALSKTGMRGGQPEMRLRIGVHTGPVITGRLSHTGEFTVTGDTVNVASRIETHAPPGGVLISRETYRQVYGYFDVEAMPPLAVKGKPEPLQTFRVAAAKPRAVAVQLRGVEGVQTEMIGRESELDAMKTALRGVIQQRSCRVITIMGEAGIGKTRLLREFQEWAELLPDSVRFFSGRATPETVNTPFSLIRDLFFARFEIQENDPPAVARGKFERGLAALLRGDSAAAPQETSLAHAHYIGQLLGLDYSASSSLRNILKDADQIRHVAFHYLSQVFNSAGGGNCDAALLVAEDIHSSDDGSLDLIRHLARSCQDSPLLIICLARPTLLERRPDWDNELPAHSRLELGTFSPEESRTLVRRILKKATEVPPALCDQIVESAEGIPLFIEEIIKMLIDREVIVPGAEQWQIKPDRLAAARIPSSLTGILQARLDGLLPAERTLLQRASVVGRVFWDASLEALSQPDETTERGPKTADGCLSQGQVKAALAGLRRKEFILRAESSAFAGAVEYTFKHDLLRSVTYETLLRKARREYHARAAKWLIGAGGERIGEFAGLVGAHYEQAARAAEAADWYGRAGHQARLSFAPAAAIDYYRKALTPLPTPPRPKRGYDKKCLEWLGGLVEVLGAQARFAEGIEACRELRILAESLGDPIAQARGWNALSFLQERLGRNRAAVESAQHAEALARGAGEEGRGEWIRALHLKGWASYRLCDAASVLALADESLELCSAFGDRRGMASSYKLKGVAHLQLGHFQKADHFFRKGRKLFIEFGDRRNTAAMWSNLGESARLRGDYPAAVRLYESALAIARQIGHRESETIYLTNLCGARLGLGQFARVEDDLRVAIRLTSDPNSCSLAETYTFLSEALLGQGKLTDARAAAERALELAQESENELYIGGAWSLLGRVASALRNQPCQAGAETPGAGGWTVSPPSMEPASRTVPEPATCFAKSVEIFRKIEAKGEVARTLRAWAECDLLDRRPAEAKAGLLEALQIFERLRAAPEVERTQALLGARFEG